MGGLDRNSDDVVPTNGHGPMAVPEVVDRIWNLTAVRTLPDVSAFPHLFEAKLRSGVTLFRASVEKGERSLSTVRFLSPSCSGRLVSMEKAGTIKAPQIKLVHQAYFECVWVAD